MLFMGLTKDQKKVKRLETDLRKYRNEQAEVINNLFEALNSGLKTMKQLYQRILRLEEGHDDNQPPTFH